MISTKLNTVNNLSNEQLDSFYNVSLSNFGIDLQGGLSRDTAKICKELNIELVWDNEYHVLRGGNENGIKVCLTI